MTEQAQYISGRTVQEQMDNLIKYVDDRSKTVAEGEAQRVLVPAEAAKVAAEAAADRAVSSVGQFESRLDGVEDGVAGNRSSIETIDGEITDIYNDLTNCVRKVGEGGQVIANGLDLRGVNKTSNTTVGQNDNQIANGKRVIDEMAAYSPMVRTTGNQDIAGVKTFTTVARVKNANDNRNVVPATQVQTQPWQVIGGDDQQIVFFQLLTNADGSRILVINMYGTDGTRGRINLMHITATGQVTFPWS